MDFTSDQLVTLVGAAIAGLLGGVGGQEIIKSITGRKPKKTVTIDNEIKMAQQAQAISEQLEKSARAAWAAAHAAEDRLSEKTREAEERVNSMERTVDEVQFKLSVMSRYIVWVLDLIREPDMSIPKLRDQVSEHKPPAGVGERG